MIVFDRDTISDIVDRYCTINAFLRCAEDILICHSLRWSSLSNYCTVFIASGINKKNDNSVNLHVLQWVKIRGHRSSKCIPSQHFQADTTYRHLG